MVDAHLPVVPQKGEQEQRRRGGQPEQQVQSEGQPPEAEAPPEGAHPVVEQAKQRPQQKALPEDDRLPCDVYVHGQRSSREKKPPRPPPTSSS